MPQKSGDNFSCFALSGFNFPIFRLHCHPYTLPNKPFNQNNPLPVTVASSTCVSISLQEFTHLANRRSYRRFAPTNHRLFQQCTRSPGAAMQLPQFSYKAFSPTSSLESFGKKINSLVQSICATWINGNLFANATICSSQQSICQQ